MDAATESVPPPIRAGASGLAIASLVLGILAICLSFLLIGGPLGLVGLILAVSSLRQQRGSRGMAWWGLGLSAFGILATAGFGLLFFRFVQKTRSVWESHAAHSPLAAWEGVMAPDFTITTIDGNRLTLSQFRGKRVVVNFWATWCPPCRKEIPHLVKLINDSSRDDVVILGISSEEAATVESFAKKNQINYPLAAAQELPPPFNDIRAVPTTFFIDRRGIIQNVVAGYRNFESLRTHALQPDYEGTPKAAPTAPASGLKESGQPLKPVALWQASVTGATTLCAGDWDADGRADVLVADGTSRLRIFDTAGLEKGTGLTLPAQFTRLAYGRHKDHGTRLAGYSVWSKKVVVINQEGQEIWSYRSNFGVNGAHWGDLDGDGTDELIVGMNGPGGLHAVGADGSLLWKISSLGNVWTQAVIPAREGRAGMVFATEAAGTVHVYDAGGKLVRTLRPGGQYCSQVGAAVTDDAGSIQLLVIGEDATMALDPMGVAAWSTTAMEDAGGWRGVSFASGDVDGDGQRDWAFLEASGDLVIATPQAVKLGAMPRQHNLDAFAIVPTPEGKAILVTLQAGHLRAFRFE